MDRCEVLSPWIEVDGRQIAQVVVDYPAAAPASWSDATGQTDPQLPPDPNGVIFYGELERQTLDALAADPTYTVLWREEIRPHDRPRPPVLTGPERAALQTRLEQAHGIPEAALARLPPGELTAIQVADGLRPWLRGRPRQADTQLGAGG
jgi:hypothetical protein